VLHASGRPVPIIATMIDSGGHHTQAVYAYARAHQHAHVYAVKGQSQAGKAVLGKPTDVDVNWRGNKIKGGVKLWPIGTDTAKAEIYGRLRTEQPGPGYVLLSRLLPPEVFEQLTAERLVTKYVKGRPRLEWVKPNGRRNEALDCAVYALAGAHFAGIDRWKEGDWLKWQNRVEERSLFDEAPAAPAPQAAPQTAPAPMSAAPQPAPTQAGPTAPPAPPTQTAPLPSAATPAPDPAPAPPAPAPTPPTPPAPAAPPEPAPPPPAPPPRRPTRDW
jgi:phage terminase large subunit GpA-like protein